MSVLRNGRRCVTDVGKMGPRGDAVVEVAKAHRTLRSYLSDLMPMAITNSVARSSINWPSRCASTTRSIVEEKADMARAMVVGLVRPMVLEIDLGREEKMAVSSDLEVRCRIRATVLVGHHERAVVVVAEGLTVGEDEISKGGDRLIPTRFSTVLTRTKMVN